ncbi:hypothetical protein HOLleu_08488 [Holothuria leucospilota]|uniref:Uncharacterized protein n=1 Tax=Holothuria leucospilota TaxID=206669 RepID=A0A9Q1CHL0_HOLLE|nr:hypothetical protein HOLleu_08488 [Holothuria leucospilota]
MFSKSSFYPGDSTPSENNFYLTILGTPTPSHREESDISDGQCYITSVASSTGSSTTSSGYCKPTEVNSYARTIYFGVKPTFHREESTSSSGRFNIFLLFCCCFLLFFFSFKGAEDLKYFTFFLEDDRQTFPSQFKGKQEFEP